MLIIPIALIKQLPITLNLSSIPRKKIANTKLKLMSNENKTKKKKVSKQSYLFFE